MKTDYNLLGKQIIALCEDENNLIANLSNISAAINEAMSHINWVGFYTVLGEELVLGPFQGKPACTRIPFSKGVCGACARTLEVQRVEDVHQFPGHIACDCASNSEIVLPIFMNGQLWGLLDIDSPEFARFSEEDEEGLKEITQIIGKILDQYVW